MPHELPPACRDLVDLQGGVISRQQAILGGMDPDVVARLVRSGRWQRLQRGSYAVFTGKPPRGAQLWAALHSAGPGAALSHQTAAELFTLTDSRTSLIHVTIPVGRRVEGISGVILHRSTRAEQARHPNLLPPRTRIEETVLDLVQQAADFDVAFDWACRACQRRLTKADLLASAMTRRSRLRWRAELSAALADIGDGVHSLLEYRYVHDVERPHGLPGADRQARVIRRARRGYLDNLYEEYKVCVELDGRAAHLDDRRWQDIHRDNAAAAEGLATLRYNWADIMRRACPTAWQVGTVLQQRGWPGNVRPCGPHCTPP